MRWTFLGLLTLACVAASGCSHTHYQVRMTPKDGGFERTITFWQEDDSDTSKREPASDDERARVGKCYDGAAEVGDQGERTFRGHFKTETPDDVGGAGRLERIETSLGTAWFYAERIRGNDDPVGELAKRQEAVDTVVGLLLGWLEREFGGEPGYPRLRAFVDEQLRHDLKNLVVCLWATPAGGETFESRSSLAGRAWLFLRQRDYLTAQDMVAVFRGLITDDAVRLLHPVPRLVARELEISPESKVLAIFREPERLGKSMDDYLGETEFYAQFTADWRASNPEKKPDEAPGPNEALNELMSEAFPLFDSEANDVLDLVLDVPCKPLSTNGKWDEAAKTVTWNVELGRPRPLPIVCSVFWTTPNAGEQERRFGRIALEGDKLLQYALWQKSLSADEAIQWGQTLAKCHGGKDWPAIVKSFRFPQEADGAALLSDQVKGWLIGEEEEEKEEE